MYLLRSTPEPDIRMKCFYYIRTDRVKSYPDSIQTSIDDEIWLETIDEIDSGYDKYITFEAMDSHQHEPIYPDELLSHE